MYEVRHEDGAIDLFKDDIAAQHSVETDEECNLAASMQPVFVIPATPEAVEGMRERVAKAMYASAGCVGWKTTNQHARNHWMALSAAALASLGLSLHHRKGRKS